MRAILGRYPRSTLRESVRAPLRLAFLAAGVDAIVVLAAVDVARRSSGPESLWVARLTARAADPWKRSLEDRIAGTRLMRLPRLGAPLRRLRWAR